jgi:hypothetical protein
LVASAGEERVAGDDERTRTDFDKGPEGCVDLARRAGLQDMRLQPEGMRRVPQACRFELAIRGVGRIDQQSNCGRGRQQFVQQVEPLSRQLSVQQRYARDVATRPVEAGDEARQDRVDAGLEDDRNSRGRRLGSECLRRAGGDNHSRLETNQVGR